MVTAKLVISGVTPEELSILSSEGFAWHPASTEANDIVIDGDELYYRMALHAIRRM